MYSLRLAAGEGLLRPDGGLDFADVAFPEKEHTDAGLTDAAAHGLGQLTGEKGFVERELRPLLAAARFKLGVESFGVNSYSHGGNFKRPLQHRVPEDYVAVERPVVIVRGSPVVALAAFERRAYLHQKNGAVALRYGVLPLFRRIIRELVLQFLGRDEGDFLRKKRFYTGKASAELELGLLERLINVFHSYLERMEVPLLRIYYFFPVPLVHIDGVERVEVLVPADCVHIGVKPGSALKAVFLERKAFPLGKGLHHLDVLMYFENVEAYRALDAVEVVVESAFGKDEKRGGNTGQLKGVRKLALEAVLNKLYRNFGFEDIHIPEHCLSFFVCHG